MCTSVSLCAGRLVIRWRLSRGTAAFVWRTAIAKAPAALRDLFAANGALLFVTSPNGASLKGHRIG